MDPLQQVRVHLIYKNLDGTTPGGMRSVPSGVSATVVEPSNFSTGGAPDQRPADERAVGAIPSGFTLPTEEDRKSVV